MRWLFFVNYTVVYFRLWRVSRLSQRFRGFERRPPSVGARAVAYRFTAVVRTVLEFPGRLIVVRVVIGLRAVFW